MAKCDEGYRCDVCGENVSEITESDLYLRYVIGHVDPETLHTASERHIGCNPALAQFIVDDAFKPVFAAGEFDKRNLDSLYVSQLCFAELNCAFAIIFLTYPDLA